MLGAIIFAQEAAFASTCCAIIYIDRLIDLFVFANRVRSDSMF